MRRTKADLEAQIMDYSNEVRMLRADIEKLNRDVEQARGEASYKHRLVDRLLSIMEWRAKEGQP